jgi:putative DNA primase/helicase
MSAPTDNARATGTLLPDIAAINLHLYTLFAPAFVQAYPDAKIEIAWADPKTGNAVNRAHIFSAFDLEKAAAFAYNKNAGGNNVYIAPALRAGTHKSGRASGEDIITARYAWCEYDGKGDAERVYALCKANTLWPAIVVTTGTIPDQRNHLYFEIDGVPTPAGLTAMGAGLKKLFGTDAVHNADRVLRLAGTINWPSPTKMGPEYGYVAELTTLRLVPDSPRYSIEKLIGLGATAGNSAGRDHFSDYADSAGKKGRTDDEIIALLEASRTSKSWHNSMLRAVASMTGKGWSDLQIKLACAPYCKGGADDPDLTELIQGGRKKWDEPDADDDDDGGGDAKQPDLKEGDERVANQAPVASELPVIHIGPRISKVTTRTQKMLIGARVPFYQRGGELVRPIIRTVKAAHGRLTKTAQLKSISPVFMRDTMCRHAHWERFDQRSQDWLRTMAPIAVAGTLLERDGVWGFPEIVGVIAAPTMRPDGSLLLKQGYDSATRLLLIEPPKIPDIPDQPTRNDALKVLALLEKLISESPFDDEPSRSVALSGLITPVVRGAFPVAPMHVSSAPVAGTGKSFLWDMVAAISTGQQRIPVIAAGNAEETEKRLVGVMLTGQPLISIDNVNGELKGDFLCQAIEQHVLDIRPLGRSEIARIETGSVTIFATGNNITIVGDLCRRTITSRLDSKEENPQLRQFKNNPIQTILNDRGAYIAACLTICRAYIVAGRPGLMDRLASFEGWSDTVRSALVWLGKADAIETMENIRAEDPQRVVLGDLLHAWADDHSTGKGSDVTLAVIIEKSMKIGKTLGLETGEFQFPDLNAAVRAAASSVGGTSFGPKVDPLRFGLWCRENKGRIVDGLFLANQPSSRGGAATWWVERTK